METQRKGFFVSQSLQKKVSQWVHQNLQQSQVRHIYGTFFEPNNQENKLMFEQIDHAPQQVSLQLFRIEQNCLVINFKAFDLYYPTLFGIINKKREEEEKVKQQEICELLQASDMILALNGENDRAWNVKKCYLDKRNIKGEHYLNIQRQLCFNSAVCLKNKKSSSYYQYRLLLISRQLQQLISPHTPNYHQQQKQQSQQQQQQSSQQQQYQNQQQQQQSTELQQQNKQSNHDWCTVQEGVCRILQREQALIERVLGRYFRNYFCWMYRIKLIQVIISSLKQHLISNKNDIMKIKNNMRINNSYFCQKPYGSTQRDKIDFCMKNEQRLYQRVINHEHLSMHKFIGKYCNDYSAYSYMISFINKYYIQRHQLSPEQYQSWKEDKVISHNQNKSGESDKERDMNKQQEDKHGKQLMGKNKWLVPDNLIEMLQKQMKWIDQLQEYCSLAYSSESHYRHLLMYKNHIQRLLKELSPA